MAEAVMESKAPARAPKVSPAEKVASMVIAQLEAGTAPWMHPVAPGVVGEACRNAKTDHEYRGVNQLVLSMLQPDKDPRWCTIHQANELEAKVHKGERGVPISALVGWETEEGERLDKDAERPRGARPLFRVYHVFHASQLDGIEPHQVEAGRKLEFEPVEKAEELLSKSGARIEHDQTKRCFYSPPTDTIHLPPRENFRSGEAYYGTALHELGHWSGHASRLDRDMGGRFGSERYAREELRAELASYMVAMEMGIGHDPSNHAAYVGSWIKALREDPAEIYRASEDAVQIVDFVMGRERSREVERAPAAREAPTRGEVAAMDVPGVGKKGIGLLPQLEYQRYLEGGEVVNAVELGGIRLGRVEQRDDDWEFQADRVGREWGLPDGLVAGTEEELQGGLQSAYRELAQRVDLAVPYSAREEAKALGAKWDPAGKTWYAMVGQGAQLGGRMEQWASERGEHRQAPQREGTDRKEGAMDVPEDRKGAGLLPQLEYRRYSEGGEFVHAVEVGGERVGHVDMRAVDWEFVPNRVGREWGLPEGLVAGTEEGLRTALQKAYEEQAQRVDLEVPYAERKDAKAQGAKWDRAGKTWYVMVGQGAQLGAGLERWTKEGRSAGREAGGPEEEFAALCKGAGLVLDGAPEMDGKLHRVAVEGGKPGRTDGAYLAHMDGHPAGFVQNWKADETHRWRYTGEGHALERHAEAVREVESRAVQRDRERAAQQAERAKEIRGELETLGPASPSHPYLVSHGVGGDVADPEDGVRAFGARQDADGNLVIPLRDGGGVVSSVQRIGANGFKRFEKGGAISGRYHVVGDERELDRGPVLLTTGFGTAAAVHAATGRPVVAAMSDTNLAKVAETVAARSRHSVLILADDDRHKEVNAGRRAAEKALDAVAVGRVAYPQWTAEERADGAMSDFADVAVARGLPAVKRQVECEVERAVELEKERVAELTVERVAGAKFPPRGKATGRER